ncbi:hypothetical protein SU69_05750 [Thermosipho melanesiensis]|uniref:Dipeptidyl aminopeptidase/acylaminoacyl-peptidase-like protein n=2 Tax=Thermosipho melanesiensis TaxID=46541 RepID=A6LM34_THEM4|nr:esterase EstD [Thermosipho melanesiensis]ABR30985.1 hypothetical protein Tmel_1130 [Thermosipho melanesiensis BI429]APT74082.1 dipeptidyl aminopeptidase [Thermosipho melanesiensis]OOC36028.1 hypothetical protein SU68_05820 [Thermosipho melanesiensis]OOC36845.1 hypothetical protein SU69_05750 [Thermosipho melanesiensis]OOC37596.1 hypothetical protein SU70_05760 [Thermosipho melanesiensis]
MRKFILIILFLSALIFASSLEDIATDYLNALITENYQKALELSSEIMKKQLSVEKMKNIWTQITATYGNFESIQKLEIVQKPPYTIFVFTSKFKNALLNISITINKDKKVDGLFFSPAQKFTYKIPRYVKTESFIEKDIKVNNLPGKLTIPKEKTEYAVILIHGSGPNDMDETIGPNKVFKDIAYGLSSNNIAVLRYDKRTLYQKDMDISIKKEVINDVLEAIKILKNQNFSRIFLLGHSLGAYIAPYIANISKDVSGIILLAPPVRNLEDVILDQLNFLKNNNEEIIKKLKALKENKLDEDEVVLGAKAKYWYDLRKYNPLNYLKGKKALILFGKNDYQVTLKDYEIFKNLKDETLKIKLFEGLTHLFTTGEKSPNAYLMENHVNVDVINEIVKFINEN